MNERNVINDSKNCYTKCVSWNAVFIGGLVGLGLSFLLNLFSAAIGLSAFSTTQEGISAFMMGGFLGFAIGGVIAMFVAGWVAGFLGRPYYHTANLGALYGFTAWCIALILGVLLAMPVAKFISISSNAITNHNLTVIHYSNSDYMSNVATTDRVPAVITVNAEKAANDAGRAAFILFILFFIGAVASSFGGYYGMMHRQRCMTSQPKM